MKIKNGENELRNSDYWEKFNRGSVLKGLVQTNEPVIFDVGANVGQSVIELEKLFSMAQFHCFEPQEECWDEFSINTSYLGDRVKLNKFALGERRERKCFYSHDLTTGQSGFYPINLQSKDSIDLNQSQAREDNRARYADKCNVRREVMVTTLDDYVSEFDVSRIDVLKIDTQGHEPEVLSGARNFLRNVSVIVSELMLYDFYERKNTFSSIEKYLIPAGFSLFDISHISKNPMNGRTDWVDLIYVRN